MQKFRKSYLAVVLSACALPFAICSSAYGVQTTVSSPQGVKHAIAQSTTAKAINPEYVKLGALLINDVDTKLGQLTLPVVIRLVDAVNAADVEKFAHNMQATHIDGRAIYANINYFQLKQLQLDNNVSAIDLQGAFDTNPPVVTTATTPVQPTDFSSSNVAVEPQQDVAMPKMAAQQLVVQDFQLFNELNKLNPHENFGYSLSSIEQAFLAVLLAMENPAAAPRPTWLLPALTDATVGQQTQSTLPESYQRYNQVLYRQGLTINKDFAQNYAKSLSGTLAALKFSNANKASEQANEIIKSQSQGLIDKLFAPNDFRQSDAVFSNIIYFKANWQSAFGVENTKVDDFTTSAGEVQQVAMMHQTLKAYISSVEGWQYIGLPFTDGSLLRIFITPEGQSDAVPNADIAWRLIETASEKEVNLQLPKLNLVSPVLSLDQIAHELGQWRMDRLIEGKVPRSPQVKHQAVVTWDESGAESTAATVVVTKRAISTPVPLKVNRPFAFSISYEGQPMFSGMVRKIPQN